MRFVIRRVFERSLIDDAASYLEKVQSRGIRKLHAVPAAQPLKQPRKSLANREK